MSFSTESVCLPSPLKRNLMRVQLIQAHLKEMFPVIYTPTEGEAIQEDFHQFGVAYLRGYLGLSDEATTYLERNEEGLFVSSAYHQEAIELGKEAIAKLAEQEETP